MKEIIIENPTRIVDLHEPMDFVRGLYARVETPGGNYTAIWEHSPEAGCVQLEKDGEVGICRNPVLIASIVSFNNTHPEGWPEGAELPVMPETFAKQFLKSARVPEADYNDPDSTFQIALRMNV